MKFVTVVIFILLILSHHGVVSAEQRRFHKKIVDNTVQFTYQWQDQNKAPQSLQFSVEKTQLFNQFRNFKSYKAMLAKRYLNRGLKKALSEKSLADVEVSFSGKQGETHVALKSQNKKALAEAYRTVEKFEKELTQQYLHKHYYQQFLNYDNNVAIKPDHARFAKESLKNFEPYKELILDKLPVKNVRNISNYVLGFVQSIPYTTLESRVTSTGAGFNPPLRVLWDNQGDCDSKVTLTATLLKTLKPEIKILLIIIDNHALLAVDIPAKPGELTINVEGFDYILAEPTGPAMMLTGQISAESEFAIRNGRYVAEAFFTRLDEEKDQANTL